MEVALDTILKERESLVKLADRVNDLKAKEKLKGFSAADANELYEGIGKLGEAIAKLEEASTELKKKSEYYQNNHLRHTEAAIRNIELIESLLTRALEERRSSTV